MSTYNRDVAGRRQVVSAGTMTGNDVRNLKGEDVGTIEEIMLETSTGTVSYAVLSFGGFLGMGDKLFAVPWGALTLNADEEGFILDVSKESLEEAPGFDKDDWPDFADPAWGRGIHEYYGVRPYWDT
jgi:sporulation protein YlmC with PRC-barrel domain